MKKKLSLNESKERTFRLLENLDSNFINPEKKGQPFNVLSPEDQALFKQIFGNSTLRSASSPRYEGNYINVGLRYWQPNDELAIKKKANEFNSKSTGHNMNVEGFTDYEVEFDNDRSWSASFMFSFTPKIKMNEQASNTQQLERFLSDLGYNQMYYQYKNNLPQLERVFSRILKGRNLSTFLRLLHPAPTPAEKSAERQRQKDDLANQDFTTRKLEYDDMVSQLQKLQPMQLIDKYMEVFNIPSEKQMELYSELLEPKKYNDPEFPETGDVELDSFEEKSEEWIEKIATKLIYGDEKPF